MGAWGKNERQKGRKVRRPSCEEDLLHLRRTGRYIPPTRPKIKQRLIVATKAPFKLVEKRLIEPLANLVDRVDLFRILEKIGFLVAILVFLVEFGERREKSIFQAWDVVKDGKNQKSGVVRLALERLRKEEFSLEGIDVQGSNLREIQLGCNYVIRNFGVERLCTDLDSANLESADLKLANLSAANLSAANLIGAKLSFANLSGANLSGANFSGANLSSAELSSAELSSAKLSGANLIGANLSGADLELANLSGADLELANLSGAKLGFANFSGANLSGANLSGAELSSAKLSGANLSGANLSGAKLGFANLIGANLSGADLELAKLRFANLSGANLQGARNLAPEEVKTADNWEKAKYSEEFRKQLGLPPEPAE